MGSNPNPLFHGVCILGHMVRASPGYLTEMKWTQKAWEDTIQGLHKCPPYHLITCATVGPHRIRYFSNDFHLADFLFCSPYKPTIIEHLLNLSTPSRSLQTNILYIIFIQIQIKTAAFYYLWITPANSILSSDLYFWNLTMLCLSKVFMLS